MIKSIGAALRTKYDFRWEVLDVIISGKSSIDSPTGFQVGNIDEADRFVQSYGYELENPIEKAEILGIFHEALNFVRKHFLQPENPDGLRLEIPRKILELADIRELVLMASLQFPGQTGDTQGNLLRNWACSLLKVMHTIAHIDRDVRSPYFTDIQKQIFDKFYKLIHRDGEGNLYLCDKMEDPARVKLAAFETKPKKARESIILKLLHKPENVAEDIFDRVGLRYITETRLDALRVIKYLKDKMAVMPPNIKPSRSRNTLVDIASFRSQLADNLTAAENGTIDEETLAARLEEAAQPPRVDPENPHSSEFYRAIQFTGRQLIKLRNPLYSEIRDLKNLAKNKQLGEELLKALERIDLKYVQREVRFFYPYEIQVVDRRSSDENEKGRSAHSEYKRAQAQTALRRVMGSLVDAAR
jgi:uncharacterized protein (TIGR04562 family)